ncbi:hypothetical protein BZA70DRAFT_272356 [Myxozyma melibiosi]|uniref:1-phosphatidylinositol-3-phosphate 5-kinase n=1 Tax=Myxozyma melibiosi TaxID=54550 RepID=A0ABR1FDF2_9ASCO
MTSTASQFTPNIKDKPAAVRHFFDRPTRKSQPVHLSRSVSGSLPLASDGSSSSFQDAKPSVRIADSMQLTPGAVAARGGKSRGMNRSSSLRGPRAPAVELNAASLSHVRRLLRQLLEELEFPDASMVTRWENALIPILLQATDDLDPDVRQGDDIDVRNYVKIKRIPGANPDDTSYLSGVVFTKNIALKSMSREIPSAKVMLLGFPVEYRIREQPVSKAPSSILLGGSKNADVPERSTTDAESGNANDPLHFMSLEPVLQQEKEHLQKLVNAITARHPNVVLTEHNISGYALQLLEQHGIAVAYNVNPKVLRAVARSTQADIIPSAEVLLKDLDKGSFDVYPRVGYCDNFEIKTYVLEQTKKKTFIFVSGCPPQLGCTIVLRGGNMETLRQIKIITEFMIYVVYNLKLETCLMRDEFVFMPAPASSQITCPRRKPVTVRSESTAIVPVAADEDKVEEDLLDTDTPGYYDSLVKLHDERIVSTSPFVQIPQPYLLWKARQVEGRLQILAKTTAEFHKEYEEAMKDANEEEGQEMIEHDIEKSSDYETNDQATATAEFTDKVEESSNEAPHETMNGKRRNPTTSATLVPKPEATESVLDHIRPETLMQLPGQGDRIAAEVKRAVLQLEHDKLEYVSVIQKRQWETYLAQTLQYLFDPFAYQHITILYSLVCKITTAPCTGPELVSIEYYRDGDCTLGQFIEGICESVDQQCSDGCTYTLAQHYRSYVHGNGRVNVSVEKMPCRIPGMENKILVWSHCNICGAKLPALPMSDNTWKYSFGKYLELSFWSTPLSLRADICSHDIHKDHVRVFSLHGLAVRFEYKPIELFDISFPRTRLLWKPQIDVRLRADEYVSIEERINNFYDSVLTRLKSVRVDEFSSSDRTEECKARLDMLRERATNECDELIDMLQEIYNESSYREYLPLNAVIRSLQERVVQWDIDFADFDRSFFPSEKDIARLTAMQLKKMFLERDTSTASFISDETPSELTSNVETAVELMPVNSEISTVASTMPEMTPATTISTVNEAGELAGPPAAINSASDFAPPMGFPSPGLPASKSDPITKTISLSGADKDPTSKDENATATASEEVGLGVSGPERLQVKTDLPNDSLSVPTANGAVTPALNVIAASPVDAEAAAASTTIVAAATPSENGTTATPSQPQAARGSLSRRKYVPERISLPPAPQFKHRFTQGTTRELARQLQLSRSGSDVHGPPTSVAGIGSSSTIGQSKVISLARHFDQLSREFEKERARERKKLAEGRLRAVGSSKPIVEVYRTIEDAVVEEEEEDEEDDFGSDEHANSDYELFSDSGTIGRRGKMRRKRPAQERTSKPDTVSILKDKLKSGVTNSSPAASTEEVGTSDRPAAVSDLVSPGIMSPLPSAYFHSAFPSDLSQPGPSEPQVNDESLKTETQGAQEEAPKESSDAKEPAREESEASSSLQSSQQSGQSSTYQAPYQQDIPPVPEKVSIMTMLSNFWADRSASGWKPLEYPLQPSEHIFMDSDVIVREDEPSSLIAFCLSSPDYMEKLHQIRRTDDQAYDSSSSDDEIKPVYPPQPHKEFYTRQRSTRAAEGGSTTPTSSHNGHPKTREELKRWLLKETGTHLKYQFQEGSAKLSCKIFYAELFDAFRTLCDCEESYIQSLSRCVKWDSAGGKSGSAFLKTLDDRLVVKQLSPSELDAFVKFAPSYFQYMAQVFFHDLPSVIAKIMGFYQVQVRNPITNKSMKMDILVMENLFYDRKLSRIFDLKGSMRNRHVEQTGKANEVLLDENMVEYIFESPLFVREYAKNILRASLWNDTLFLAKMNVMDYSLVIAIDHERNQLVVGIIDCLRTFTWDKKLESWVKERGLVGGGGKIPTVVTPRQYKNRFREAMERYVLMVPDFWHH